MSLIDAKQFFSTKIRDNQITPLRVCEYVNLNGDFCCDTSGTWHKNRPGTRKDAMLSFLKGVREELEKVDLKKYEITYLIGDNEFDFNQDNTILSITGDSFDDVKISSSNIVGSLNLKGEQLNINCRFGQKFLGYMIASTSGFIELENFGSISEHRGLGEWILLFYWKTRLKRAFAQGIYKTYQKKRENLSTIRGAIDINLWMKKDFFDGKTICEFKEHSFDNNINKVIYLALRKVSRSIYADLLNDIYEIKRAFNAVPFSNLNYNFSYNQVSNLYYKNYNEVFELSKRILQDQFMSFSSHNAEFSAFLFDVSLLFEHHIRKLVKRKFKLKTKDLAEFSVPNGIGKNNLLPDIIIDYGNREIGVFDVKYKHFLTEGRRVGVAREDRFQLISYIAYYMSGYTVVNSGFIYPCDDGSYSNKMSKIDHNQKIEIAGVGVPFGIYLYRVKSDMNLQLEFDKEFCKCFMLPPNH